jgi:hypothetical protein
MGVIKDITINGVAVEKEIQSVLPTAIEESLVQIGRPTPRASLQQELTEGLLVLRSTLKQSEPDGGLCHKVLHNLNQQQQMRKAIN